MGYIESIAPKDISPERLAEAREIDARLDAMRAAIAPQIDLLNGLAMQMHSIVEDIEAVQQKYGISTGDNHTEEELDETHEY